MTMPIFMISDGWKLKLPMAIHRVAPPSVTPMPGTNTIISSRMGRT